MQLKRRLAFHAYKSFPSPQDGKPVGYKKTLE